MQVYLLHYANGMHYLGSTEQALCERMRQHRSGKNSSALTDMLAQNGIPFEVARTWDCQDDESRDLEFIIRHRQEHKKLCPVCSPDKAERLAVYYRRDGKWMIGKKQAVWYLGNRRNGHV